MGLSYPDKCDGCPKVENNLIAFDDAAINHERDLQVLIQDETDRFTGNCELGSQFDGNRDEFVCRTGELAVVGVQTTEQQE